MSKRIEITGDRLRYLNMEGHIQRYLFRKLIAGTYRLQYYPGMLLTLKNGSQVVSEVLVAVMIMVRQLAEKDLNELYELAARCHEGVCTGAFPRVILYGSPLVRNDGSMDQDVLNIIQSATVYDPEELSVGLVSPLALDVHDSQALLNELIRTSEFGLDEAKRELFSLLRR